MTTINTIQSNSTNYGSFWPSNKSWSQYYST